MTSILIMLYFDICLKMAVSMMYTIISMDSGSKWKNLISLKQAVVNGFHTSCERSMNIILMYNSSLSFQDGPNQILHESQKCAKFFAKPSEEMGQLFLDKVNEKVVIFQSRKKPWVSLWWHIVWTILISQLPAALQPDLRNYHSLMQSR